MAGCILVKRVFESAAPEDGLRVLVDRQWPGGLSKAEAQAALWMREAAPSDALSDWYGQNPGRFAEFRARYRAALDGKANAAFVYTMERSLKEDNVTLLHAAEDEVHSGAAVLAEWLEERLSARARIKEEKKALRREIRAKGETLDESYRQRANLALREKIFESDAWRQAQAVFVFVSVWDEPDTYPILAAALESGKALYVPRCYPGRIMKAVRISSIDELRPGTLGIPEPVNDRETAGIGGFSLALIPCVSAWKDGRRMGHGVGYYDRFLVDRHCRKFCLCYEALLSDQIPMDAHDIRMDAVVTERALYEP